MIFLCLSIYKNLFLLSRPHKCSGRLSWLNSLLPPLNYFYLCLTRPITLLVTVTFHFSVNRCTGKVVLQFHRLHVHGRQLNCRNRNFNTGIILVFELRKNSHNWQCYRIHFGMVGEMLKIQFPYVLSNACCLYSDVMYRKGSSGKHPELPNLYHRTTTIRLTET